MDETLTALASVEIDALTISRKRRGRGWSYVDADGTVIRDEETLERIRHLAIPPAYAEVRIAADPLAHLQAIGRDAAGRLQYRYHPDWDAVREARKMDRMRSLLGVLPRIRAAVQRDMGLAMLGRRKAAACAVAIIDATHIRVGCEPYVESGGARGAATLLKRQARVGSTTLALSFRGKGGTLIRCAVADRQIARCVRRIATLSGRRLLQFEDDRGEIRPLRAEDVNAYLKRVSGRDISAKDFRMMAASASATEQFAALEPGTSRISRRRQIRTVMRLVSTELANTPAVVRKSYVHQTVIRAFEDGHLVDVIRNSRAGRMRSRAENALQRLISAQLVHDL